MERVEAEAAVAVAAVLAVEREEAQVRHQFRQRGLELSVCADKGTDCPSRAYLCSNAVYYDLMTQQCPKTCARC